MRGEYCGFGTLPACEDLTVTGFDPLPVLIIALILVGLGLIVSAVTR